MPIDRQFLGSKQPHLHQVVAFLRASIAGTTWDLSNFLCVVPGSRAGRRLLELLVLHAENEKLTLTPPQITTEGRLPELLYTPKRPFATDLTQQLAWAKALATCPAAKLHDLIPNPPPTSDLDSWLSLASALRLLHNELAAEKLAFADVVKALEGSNSWADVPRWRVLSEIQAAYWKELDDAHLWDAQTARLVAIEKNELHLRSTVLLIGTVDLTRTVRKMLQLIGTQVIALLPVDASLADTFDLDGCLISEAWATRHLPITQEHYTRVDGPADQAAAVADWLRALGGKYHSDEIAIGVPDEAIVSQLERELEQSGIKSRAFSGTTVGQTLPSLLLDAIVAYVLRERYDELASLVRHPDLHDWIERKSAADGALDVDPVAALDEYYGEHYSARLDEELLAREASTTIPEGLSPSSAAHRRRTRSVARSVKTTVDLVHRLIAPLRTSKQPLARWGEALRAILLEVYHGRQLDRRIPRDRMLLEATSMLAGALDAPAKVPAKLSPAVSLSAAIDLLVSPVLRSNIPPPAEAGAIELLGWLELPLDDARAAIITTFNEGYIPAGEGSAMFLSSELRTTLGIQDAKRRVARDAFALFMLAESKAELLLVVAHRDVEKNPLAPSRLLFATEPLEAARRGVQLFSALPATPTRRIALAPQLTRLSSGFQIPLPDTSLPIEDNFSVSQFKAYLACPYRFYLRHVLRLSSMNDAADELEPRGFGSLIHDVLQSFGRSDEVRDSTHSTDIFDFLAASLQGIVSARLGERACRAAVRVQVEQIRSRLQAFAKWQAARTATGWRIVYTEDFDKQLTGTMTIDDKPVILRGRIDRIDRHDDTQTLAVLDYKTADTPNAPKAAHRKPQSGEWVDLQLPLYRHLLPAAAKESADTSHRQLQLGYIQLPKSLENTGDHQETWTKEELESADAAAADVVRAIRERVFWPPKSSAAKLDEEFQAICQDRLLLPWRHVKSEESFDE